MGSIKKNIILILVNLLTLSRIVGVFCIVPIFINYGGVAAAILSICCYLTDMADGIIARKCKVCCFWGSIFDGIADKLFSLANLIILITITKFAIFPIACEFAILLVQTFKFSKNQNVQSSLMGKLKTWIIALTVILLYFVTDIESITILPTSFISYIQSLNPAVLYGIMFIPLYVFEILTLISYLKFLPDFDPDKTVKLPVIDLKLKETHNFKDKWDNFCALWINYDFYMRYKDSAGLKDIRKFVKDTKNK